MYKYILTIHELAEMQGKTAREVEQELPPDFIISVGSLRKAISPNAAREYLQALGISFTFRVISHINLKGGIGKTTSCITAATRAVQYGFRTCVLDLDPQASSTVAFGIIPEDEDLIFYDIWQETEGSVSEALKAIQDGLCIIPSSLENSLLDLSLVNPSAQKNAVRRVCSSIKELGYDLVFIDCPPSLGTAVISSISASDVITIPVGSDLFSIKGLELTLQEIDSIIGTFGLNHPEVRILNTRFDKREKIALETVRILQSRYPDMFLPVVIRTSTEFPRALARRETVFASSKKSQAREDYDLYVRRLLGLPVPEQEASNV